MNPEQFIRNALERTLIDELGYVDFEVAEIIDDTITFYRRNSFSPDERAQVWNCCLLFAIGLCDLAELKADPRSAYDEPDPITYQVKPERLFT